MSQGCAGMGVYATEVCMATDMEVRDAVHA